MATGSLLVLTAASMALQSLSTLNSSKAAIDKANQLDEVAKEEARRAKIEGLRLERKQRVKFAGSGADISALGSTPLDVLAQTAEDTELNALRVRFGFDSRASDIRAAGEQRTLQGIAGITDTAIQAGFRVNSLRQGGTSGRTLIGQNDPGRDAFPTITAPPGGPGRGGRF